MPPSSTTTADGLGTSPPASPSTTNPRRPSGRPAHPPCRSAPWPSPPAAAAAPCGWGSVRAGPWAPGWAAPWGCGWGGGQPAFQAQGAQSAGAGRERDRGGGDPQRQRPPVDGDAQPARQPRALAVPPGGRLGVADPAVAVAVDRLAGLEGGDLGHVEDVVDDQPVGADPQAAVAVD